MEAHGNERTGSLGKLGGAEIRELFHLMAELITQ
jgi:hypothetical protein